MISPLEAGDTDIAECAEAFNFILLLLIWKFVEPPYTAIELYVSTV
jgi:hypothetical protein